MNELHRNELHSDKAAEPAREDEPYVIPNEGCCSPEFPQGCIIADS